MKGLNSFLKLRKIIYYFRYFCKNRGTALGLSPGRGLKKGKKRPRQPRMGPGASRTPRLRCTASRGPGAAGSVREGDGGAPSPVTPAQGSEPRLPFLGFDPHFLLESHPTGERGSLATWVKFLLVTLNPRGYDDLGPDVPKPRGSSNWCHVLL